MDKKSKNFLAKARSWITKNNLHGPHAFLRFVMLVFVERLNQTSDEFIFKGGNLLWVYIKTPRATVDVDFVTRSLSDNDSVRLALEAACQAQDGNVTFLIKNFAPVETQGALGAAVTVSYQTEGGQANSFDLDIVYAIPSDTTTIPSPLQGSQTVHVVTIENIVADKLAAAHRHRSGNSRMKDFDDLWRISSVLPDPIDWQHLAGILAERSIKAELDQSWVGPQMEQFWQAHLKRHKELPQNLILLIQQVNDWLGRNLTQ